jgi:lipid-A-disaccharide synthase
MTNLKGSPHFFILAGEPSGDLHGSHLMNAIKSRCHSAVFWGVGGPKMNAQGLDPLFSIEKLSVMGFTDVIRALPRLWKLFYQVRDAVIEKNPEVVILIDYADFNLRLAKALRKANFKGKIIHYISPSVWAWRKNRIKTLSENVDLLLTIYPFEAQHYSSTDLPVKFVGNPLTEYLSKYSYVQNWKEQLKIPADVPLIAMFPGSRRSEISYNLPMQLNVVKKMLVDQPELRFAISCSGDEQEQIIKEMTQKYSLKIGRELFLVPKSMTYELMQGCHSAMAKSGTVTLELALHQRPTVVIYKMGRVNHFIAKYVLRLNLPHYCIVNILAEGEVFPELIENGLTEENLFHHLHEISKEGPARQLCLDGCHRVVGMLSDNDASKKAATAILELIE